MGGIGKTTIVGVLFKILCSEYEGCCFLENIREQLEKDGILQLKRKLISILFEEKDPNIGIPNAVPTHVLRKLHRRKILIVLDDVNNPNQVRNLVGGRDWLWLGSRIIVTTRDKHVIEKEANIIYDVKALGSHEALKLLKFHASKENCLQMNWHELFMKVVKYAKGIPLALEVLGSFLYGKSAREWGSQLEKLKKMPFVDIQNVLRLSYERLDHEEKSIFLYIACFFEGSEIKVNVEALLDARGYSMPIALKSLEDKALITRTISTFGDRVGVSMHDLIQEMGREIIREQSIDKPGERHHLWDLNDIYCVLEHVEGTKHIESITLNMSRIKDLILSPQSFAGMVNLKFLRLYTCLSDGYSRVHLPEGLNMLSDKIILFHWDGYPSKSLPATFNAENLVELHMRGSYLTKLWDGVPNLPKLKEIDLVQSELVELLDLSIASSLEHIDLRHCRNLLCIHPSIFCLQHLQWVLLGFCERLEGLPDIEALPSSDKFYSPLIHYLDLEWCESLKHLPDSLSKLRSLLELNLSGCIQLDTSNLQNILGGLSSLEWLTLNRCHNLCEIPENISKLSSLEHLILSGISIKSLPESIKHLPRLDDLRLSNCKRLQSIPEIPASLFLLLADGCTSLETLFTPTPELLEEHIRIKHITLMSERRLTVPATFVFDDCPNLDKDALQAVLAYVNCSNNK